MSILSDASANASDRFVAAVRLEEGLDGTPERQLLLRALQKRRLREYQGFGDHVMIDVFLTGHTIFHLFTPAKLNHHMPCFTCAACIAGTVVFFFMAGTYPMYYVTSAEDNRAAACLRGAGAGLVTPSALTQWITTKKGHPWCFQGNAWQFNGEFLVLWGALYGPAMREQGYRWLSSVFVHQSFNHVFSNIALLVAIGWQVERKYGSWRVALLFWFAAIGGAFFAGVTQSACTPTVGASGGIFGMMGLFFADMIMNYRTLTRPFLRGAWVLAFLIYAVVSAAVAPAGTSVMSHVGGFVCGLFPSFLFLPNLSHEKWEAALPPVAVLFTLIVYTTLPVYFYQHTLRHLTC